MRIVDCEEYYSIEITTNHFYDVISSILYRNKEGEFHHKNEPAVIDYANGKIEYIGYYFNGKRHNMFGPAIIVFSSVGYSLSTAY